MKPSHLFFSTFIASVFGCASPPEPRQAPPAEPPRPPRAEVSQGRQAAVSAAPASASAPAPASASASAPAPASASASAPASASASASTPAPALAPTLASAPAPAPKSSDKSPGHTAGSGYTGDSPCQGTKFRFAAIRSACQQGGRPAAKGVMKGVVQKAKAAGQDLKCTSCHTDTKTFQLTEDAPKKLSEWL